MTAITHIGIDSEIAFSIMMNAMHYQYGYSNSVLSTVLPSQSHAGRAGPIVSRLSLKGDFLNYATYAKYAKQGSCEQESCAIAKMTARCALYK